MIFIGKSLPNYSSKGANVSCLVRYTGWKAHSELASTSQDASKSLESAREVDTITWIGAFVNIGLAGFKVRARIFNIFSIYLQTKS